jgi:hypothetical protein
MRLHYNGREEAMSDSHPRPSAPPPRAALPPPQFGLRTLLLVVTACAILAALSQWVTPIVLACVVFLVVSILAHVAGNAIGTKLREFGSRPSADDAAVSPGLARARPKADDFAPPTRLGERHGLGWPILIAAAAGTLSGAVGGVVWTLVSSRGPVGLLNVSVGAIAFAVLGGIIAFVAFGFVQVGLSALRQASAENKN